METPRFVLERVHKRMDDIQLLQQAVQAETVGLVAAGLLVVDAAGATQVGCWPPSAGSWAPRKTVEWRKVMMVVGWAATMGTGTGTGATTDGAATAGSGSGLADTTAGIAGTASGTLISVSASARVMHWVVHQSCTWHWGSWGVSFRKGDSSLATTPVRGLVPVPGWSAWR